MFSYNYYNTVCYSMRNNYIRPRCKPSDLKRRTSSRETILDRPFTVLSREIETYTNNAKLTKNEPDMKEIY